MEQFYYKSTTKHNNTEYYNMEQEEYRRLTSHILTFLTTLLERGTINAVRESEKERQRRYDIISKDQYRNKSTLHTESISMLDALCGIVAKINKRSNNDLTNRQIDMFNTIVRDFSSAICGRASALDADVVGMVQVDDAPNKHDNFNNLFE